MTGRQQGNPDTSQHAVWMQRDQDVVLASFWYAPKHPPGTRFAVKKHNPTLGGKTDKALMMATHERRLRACHNETFQVLNLAMTCH